MCANLNFTKKVQLYKDQLCNKYISFHKGMQPDVKRMLFAWDTENRKTFEEKTLLETGFFPRLNKKHHISKRLLYLIKSSLLKEWGAELRKATRNRSRPKNPKNPKTKKQQKNTDFQTMQSQLEPCISFKSLDICFFCSGTGQAVVNLASAFIDRKALECIFEKEMQKQKNTLRNGKTGPSQRFLRKIKCSLEVKKLRYCLLAVVSPWKKLSR